MHESVHAHVCVYVYVYVEVEESGIKQECRELAHEDNFLVHKREARPMLLDVTEVGTP